MAQSMPSFLFGGDCEVSRFVKLSNAADHTVVRCGAGEAAIGVSFEGSKDAPIPGVTPLAASSGMSTRVYQIGESCELTAGGVVAAGDYLKSDSTGRGVAASSNDKYYAIARAAASAAGQAIKVTIAFGTV